MKYVGLSLSGCIRDIINGEMYLDDVAFIIAGTCMEIESDFLYVLDRYCAMWDWKKNPLEARRVATKLWKSGKIRQPRFDGGVVPNPKDGCWLEYDPDKDSGTLCPACRNHWSAAPHACINNKVEFCTCCPGCDQFCAEFPASCQNSQEYYQ